MQSYFRAWVRLSKNADGNELSQNAPPDKFCSSSQEFRNVFTTSLVNSSKLMLDTDKTEVIPTNGSSFRLSMVDYDSENIGDISLKTVKYIGVKIDHILSMQNQICSVCRTLFPH